MTNRNAKFWKNSKTLEIRIKNMNSQLKKKRRKFMKLLGSWLTVGKYPKNLFNNSKFLLPWQVSIVPSRVPIFI